MKVGLATKQEVGKIFNNDNNNNKYNKYNNNGDDSVRMLCV